jgi:hypothetical protein
LGVRCSRRKNAVNSVADWNQKKVEFNLNLLSYNSPIMRFLERVFDLVVLNLMTLVLCIPLVTAGAAMTALYKTLFDIRLQKGRTIIGF